mmetsp:Transcript_72432/g.132612  ORF Transcript_72432/g.132612 Transcript_72432/m.132612 type:complete len:588 (+) Transcript_72432:137-1900(+)
MYGLRSAFLIWIYLLAPVQAHFHVERPDVTSVEDALCQDASDASLSLIQRRSRPQPNSGAKSSHEASVAETMSAVSRSEEKAVAKGKKDNDPAGPTFSVVTMESMTVSVDVVSLAVVLPALVWLIASSTHSKTVEIEEDIRVAKDTNRGSRIALVDNGRFIAMLSVVLGQCFLSGHSKHSQKDGLFSSMPPLQASFFYVPAVFNIPFFCLISGILSQGAPSSQRCRHFVVYLVIPYIFYIFAVQPLIVIPLSSLSLQTSQDQLGKWISFNPITTLQNNVDKWGPTCNPWYLYALICWRGMAMLSARLSNPSVFFVGSLFLGSFSGYLNLDGPCFQFGRVFAYMPYFAIGYVFPLESMCQGTSPNNVLFVFAAWALVISMLFVLSIYGPHWGFELINEGFDAYVKNNPNQALEDRSFYLLWLRRLSKNVLDSMGAAALLMLVPRRKGLFTWVGKYSMFVFLLHGIVISWRVIFLHFAHYKALSGWPDYLAGFSIHLFLSLTICVCCASWPLRFLFGWAFEPKWLDVLCQHAFGSRLPHWKLIAEQKKLASEQFEWQRPAACGGPAEPGCKPPPPKAGDDSINAQGPCI